METDAGGGGMGGGGATAAGAESGAPWRTAERLLAITGHAVRVAGGRGGMRGDAGGRGGPPVSSTAAA